MSSQQGPSKSRASSNMSSGGNFWGHIQLDRLSDVGQNLILRSVANEWVTEVSHVQMNDDEAIDTKQNEEETNHQPIEIVLSRIGTSDTAWRRPRSRNLNGAERSSKLAKRPATSVRRTRSRHSVTRQIKTKRRSQTRSCERYIDQKIDNNNNDFKDINDNINNINSNNNNFQNDINNNININQELFHEHMNELAETSTPIPYQDKILLSWQANALPTFPQQGPDLTVRGSSTGIANESHAQIEPVQFPSQDLLYTSFRFPTNSQISLEPARFLAFKPLRLLDMEGWGVNDETISKCVNTVPNISVLHCPVSTICSLTIATLENMTALENRNAWTGLRHLDFSGCFASVPSTDLDKSLSRMLRRCGHSIVSLALNGTSISDLTLIAVGETCEKLTRLEVCRCGNITDYGLANILDGCPLLVELYARNVLGICGMYPALAGRVRRRDDEHLGSARLITPNHAPLVLAPLRVLCLSNCVQLSENGVNLIARACSLLEDMDLSHCVEVTDKTVLTISSQCQLPGLKRLNLTGCSKVTDKSVKALVKHSSKTLTSLALSGTSVSIQMVAWMLIGLPHLIDLFAEGLLTRIPKLVDARLTRDRRGRLGELQLKSLSLRGNPDVLENLFKDLSACCAELEDLNLAECVYVSDDIVHRFAKHSEKLQHINLAGCIQLTDEALLKIAQYAKNLVVLDVSLPRPGENSLIAYEDTERGTQAKKKLNHHSDAIKGRFTSPQDVNDRRMGDVRGWWHANTPWVMSPKPPYKVPGIPIIEAAPEPSAQAIMTLLNGCQKLECFAMRHFQMFDFVTTENIDCSTTNKNKISSNTFPKNLSCIDMSGCTNLTRKGLLELGLCLPGLIALNLEHCCQFRYQDVLALSLSIRNRACGCANTTNEVDISIPPAARYAQLWDHRRTHESTHHRLMGEVRAQGVWECMHNWSFSQGSIDGMSISGPSGSGRSIWPLTCGIAPHPEWATREQQRLYLQRKELEHNSSTKIQKKYRKYKLSLPTVKYLILLHKGVVGVSALRIQMAWRSFEARRAKRIRSTNFHGATIIQRSIRAHLWRKRVRAMISDEQLRITRERIAALAKRQHHAAKLVEKWYKQIMWFRSVQGLAHQARQRAAVLELQTRKAIKIWKGRFTETIINDLPLYVDHLRMFRSSIFVSRKQAQVGFGMTYSQGMFKVSGAADAVVRANRRHNEFVPIFDSSSTTSRREIRAFLPPFAMAAFTLCSKCNRGRASLWCFSCRNVFCSTCDAAVHTPFMPTTKAAHPSNLCDPSTHRRASLDQPLVDRPKALEYALSSAVVKTAGRTAGGIRLRRADQEASEKYDDLLVAMSSLNQAKDVIRKILEPVNQILQVRKLVLKELLEVVKDRRLQHELQTRNKNEAFKFKVQIHAQTIQRFFRGVLARLHCDKMKSDTIRSAAMAIAKHRSNAATKIQAVIRSMEPRHLWKKLISDGPVQSTEEMVLLRDRFADLYSPMLERDLKRSIRAARQQVIYHGGKYAASYELFQKEWEERFKEVKEQHEIIGAETYAISREAAVCVDTVEKAEMALELNHLHAMHAASSKLIQAVENSFGEAQAKRTAKIQAHPKSAFHYLTLATILISRWERIAKNLDTRRKEIEQDPPVHKYHKGTNEQLKRIVSKGGKALDERLMDAVGAELKWIMELQRDVIPRERKNKLLEEEAILLREASRARDLESGEKRRQDLIERCFRQFENQVKYRQELKLMEREKFDLKVKRANAQADENNEVNNRFLVLLNSESALRAKINAMYLKVDGAFVAMTAFINTLDERVDDGIESRMFDGGKKKHKKMDNPNLVFVEQISTWPLAEIYTSTPVLHMIGDEEEVRASKSKTKTIFLSKTGGESNSKEGESPKNNGIKSGTISRLMTRTFKARPSDLPNISDGDVDDEGSSQSRVSSRVLSSLLGKRDFRAIMATDTEGALQDVAEHSSPIKRVISGKLGSFLDRKKLSGNSFVAPQPKVVTPKQAKTQAATTTTNNVSNNDKKKMTTAVIKGPRLGYEAIISTNLLKPHTVSPGTVEREFDRQVWVATLPRGFFAERVAGEVGENGAPVVYESIEVVKLREAEREETRALITTRQAELNVPDKIKIRKNMGNNLGKMTRNEYAVAVLGLTDVSTAMNIEENARKEAKKNRWARLNPLSSKTTQPRSKVVDLAMQSVLQRQRGAVGVSKVISDLQLVVGGAEDIAFSSKQAEKRRMGLPFFEKMQGNLGKDFGVHLWYKTSMRFEEGISSLALSHPHPKHRLHKDLDKKGYKRVTHKQLDGQGQTGFEMWIKHGLTGKQGYQVEEALVGLALSQGSDQARVHTNSGMQKIKTDLAEFGLANGSNLWKLKAPKGTNPAVKNLGKNLSAMTEQRDGYQALLAQQPHNHDLQMKLRKVLDEISMHELKPKRDLVEESREFLALDVNEMRRFVDLFHEMDVDESGSVSTKELFNRIKVPETTFTTKLFKFLDSSGDGALDFGEFLHAIGTICTLGAQQIPKLCFTLADIKGHGALSSVELGGFIEQLHGGNVSDVTLQKKVMTACDNTREGVLRLTDFLLLQKRYPTMLFPMFRLQKEMRTACLGEQYWNRKREVFSVARKKVQDGEKIREKEQKKREEEGEKKKLNKGNGGKQSGLPNIRE